MVIQVTGIKKYYDKQLILNDLNFTLSSKFTTILGESGCGKTTLLKLFSGLIEPDDGEIKFEEEIFYSAKEKINLKPNQRNIAMVFQDFALWPHMTVFENVAYSLKGNKSEIKETVIAALKLVNLDTYAHRKPGELSGGQQQRVSLARAIAPQPKLILFDEALSSLDAVLREKMQIEIVQLIKKTNSQAIFVTHDQNEAMSMSDQIIVMEKGQVSQIGTPKEIYETPVNHYVAHFIGKINQLSENEFIRPERIRTAPVQNKTLSVNFRVTKSQFTGEHFVIHGYFGAFPWQFYSQIAFEEEENFLLYYNQNDLTIIGG